MKKYIYIILVIPLILSACAPSSATSATTLVPTRIPTRTPLAPVTADSLQLGQHAYVFQAASGESVRYWLYLPENFNPEKKWPLILFLHGSSERGLTITKVIAQGLPELLETKKDLPFIVISPQLESGWWDKMFTPLNELLDHLVETLPVNPDQLYLTGISLGGFGTWSYALQYPDRFTAIAPIAGGIDEQVPEDICKLKDLPIWAFHGDADQQVDPQLSQILVDALQACGSDIKFTLYPDTSHNSTWDKAYTNPALYEWFLAHKK